jgi:hypothetical protein
MARYGYNPLAPTPPKAQRRQARRYVNSMILPLLGQLNAEFTRRSQAGQAAIGAGTANLAAALAPAAGQTQANYARARAEQQTEEAAFGNRLTAAGATLQGSLGSQLGAAGIPAAAAGNLAGIGAGAGSASAAFGSANIARLIAQGAAAQEYTGQLPNIARLGGAQRAGQLGQQLESERATQAGAIRAKIPGLVSQIGQQQQAQEFQKAIAQQSGLISQQKFRADVAYKGAKLQQGQQALDIRRQQAKVTDLYKRAGLQISQQQLQIAAHREERLSRAKSGKKGGFTPKMVADFQSGAIESVQNHKHGVIDPNDPNAWAPDPANPGQFLTPKPKDPRGAFVWLVNHGYPPSIADWAVGRVYGKWKSPALGKIPGGHGR